LEIEVYQTVDNKITTIGKSSIRISKLYFLRNNHLYNGKVVYNHIMSGEYILGFEMSESRPFHVIEEEDTLFDGASQQQRANSKSHDVKSQNRKTPLNLRSNIRRALARSPP
jgi:hypothetical protein